VKKQTNFVQTSAGA